MHEKKNYPPISVFYFFTVSYGAISNQVLDCVVSRTALLLNLSFLRIIKYTSALRYRDALKDLPPLFSTNANSKRCSLSLLLS